MKEWRLPAPEYGNGVDLPNPEKIFGKGNIQARMPPLARLLVAASYIFTSACAGGILDSKAQNELDRSQGEPRVTERSDLAETFEKIFGLGASPGFWSGNNQQITPPTIEVTEVVNEANEFPSQPKSVQTAEPTEPNLGLVERQLHISPLDGEITIFYPVNPKTGEVFVCTESNTAGTRSVEIICSPLGIGDPTTTTTVLPRDIGVDITEITEKDTGLSRTGSDEVKVFIASFLALSDK